MSDFDDVSTLIGSMIDEAFKTAVQNILDAANSNNIAALGVMPSKITMGQLQSFFGQLGGIDAEVLFLSKLAKPAGSYMKPAVITPKALPAGGVGALSVDISIGVGIKIGF